MVNHSTGKYLWNIIPIVLPLLLCLKLSASSSEQRKHWSAFSFSWAARTVQVVILVGYCWSEFCPALTAQFQQTSSFSERRSMDSHNSMVKGERNPKYEDLEARFLQTINVGENIIQNRFTNKKVYLGKRLAIICLLPPFWIFYEVNHKFKYLGNVILNWRQ